jgi:hypothetical protein
MAGQRRLGDDGMAPDLRGERKQAKDENRREASGLIDGR